jgi:hypothetical protein
MKNPIFGGLRFKAQPLSKEHPKFVPHIFEREPPILTEGLGSNVFTNPETKDCLYLSKKL